MLMTECHVNYPCNGIGTIRLHRFLEQVMKRSSLPEYFVKIMAINGQYHTKNKTIIDIRTTFFPPSTLRC